MKFSHLKRASIVCIFWWISQIGATAEEYEAGIDYKVIEIKEDSEATQGVSDELERISVIEYFSYGCLHCKKFEEHIAKWLANKEDDVEFRREAVVFQKSWAKLALAYYVAIELDVLGMVHMPMFEAVHDEKRNMDARKNIEQLFVDEAEVDPQVFRTTFEDQSIVDHILEVHEKVQSMTLKNTPTVVVDGKYLVNTQTAQSRKRIFPIVDFLVKKVRAERQNVSSIEPST